MIAARVILGAQALWLVLSRPHLADLAAWPDGFWNMPPPARLRFGILRVDGIAPFESAAWILLHIALIAVVLGVLPRLSMIVSALLLYHFAPFEAVVSSLLDIAGVGGFTLPLLGFMILASVPTPKRDAAWSPDYRWPVVLIQLIFAFNYVGAGLAKLHWAGLGWYSMTNVGNLSGIMSTFQSLRLALFVYQHRGVAAAIGVATFLLEFLFPLAIFSKWARRIIIPAAVVAFILRIQILGFFFPSFPSLLLFINWDDLDRKRRPKEAMKPEVEMNLLAAQRDPSAAVRGRVEELSASRPDWRKIVEFAQLHGTSQFLDALIDATRAPIDAQCATILKALVQRNSARAFVQYRESLRIAKALSARGIRAIPYKGTVLSVQLFGRANARISADIDILIAQSDFHGAVAVLAELGYARTGYAVADQVFLDRWKDATFQNERIHTSVDLQWRAMAKDSTCGFATETSLLNTVPFSADRSIPTLADDSLFLILAHHGLSHRWESLKWIVDIDAFCRRSDVSWETIAARARESGSWNIVLLAVHLAVDLLHTPVPLPFTSPVTRVSNTVQRLAGLMRRAEQMSDLEAFWIPFKLRERWRDRIDFIRFVCLPKPRDIAEGRFLGLPAAFQPLLRPLRLLVESHKGHKRVVTDVQRVLEWDD